MYLLIYSFITSHTIMNIMYYRMTQVYMDIVIPYTLDLKIKYREQIGKFPIFIVMIK